MFQYIVKRLLLMIVTLFGITVITFAVTRLAPGDPAKMQVSGPGMAGDRDAQQSQELIDLVRRTLGLDKPMLFNLRGADRDTEAADALDRYLTKSDFFSEEARRDLLSVDVIALQSAATTAPLVVDSLAAKRLVDLGAELTERLGADPLPDDFAQWPAWINDYTEGLDDRSLRQAAQAYVSGDESAEPLLRRGGALSMAPLMAFIKKGKGESAERASRLAASITRKPLAVEAGMPDEEKARLFDRWSRWWQYDYVRYSSFSAPHRFARHFTYTQYGIWVTKIMTFDFDVSYTRHQPVLDLIKERLPISIQLSLISITLAYMIAIPLGIYSAIRQYSRLDRILTIMLFVLYSLPGFWVGNMLILYFTGKPYFDWFPTGGLHGPGVEAWTWPWFKDWLWHLVLPIFCLTYASFAFLSRQMRASMLETVRQDFIRTARAKGLSERVVIFKHALRNSLIPILTLSATLLPELLGGSVIIESIFQINGMGRLTYEAILQRDYPIINGVLFFSALLTLCGILLADLSYALADPRIKLK